MRELIACCGLDCEKCDARIATIHNDDALREKTARLWSELNQVPITADMIQCMGCRANGVKTPFCDGMCEIRKCVQKKGLETCGNCPEMDDCKVLNTVIANSAEALDNLKSQN